MKVKNYCICKIKKNVIYRNPNCFAKYTHNGKKTVDLISYPDPEFVSPNFTVIDIKVKSLINRGNF